MTDIPSWTSLEERVYLRQLAAEVPDGGEILEIGCLYGGTTYELASVNPKVFVLSIDNFSWTPEGYPQVSPELTAENLHSRGIRNVNIWMGTSEEAARHWDKQVDLCFIDGGHSYQYVNADLNNFAKFSKVIALHDYHNPAEWMGITRAVDEFLLSHDEWYLANITGMIVTLRRRS